MLEKALLLVAGIRSKRREAREARAGDRIELPPVKGVRIDGVIGDIEATFVVRRPRDAG